MLFASFSRCRGLKLSRVCCRGGLILRKCSPVVGAVPLPRNYANSAKFDKVYLGGGRLGQVVCVSQVDHWHADENSLPPPAIASLPSP